MKSFLADNFPQTPVAEGIDEGELARFAESPGGRFPDPQYCPGLQWVVNASKDNGKPAGGGVALLGDAIHAFPPDLGQVRMSL